MTSGVFEQFPVDQIWVDRAKRQRKEITPKELSELAGSIRDIGLINTPVIKRDGELVAGERRWQAVKSIGWTHMPVQFAEDLSADDLYLLELEENTKRQDLTWQEKAMAVEQYHSIRAKNNPEWTAIKTAEALNISPVNVSHNLSVAKEIKDGNKKIIEAPRFSVARGITMREKAREKSSIVADINLQVKGEALVKAEKKPVPLLNIDFNEWVKDYNGPKFNFIHCDFPYGIGADEHDQGGAAAMGGYADGLDVYHQLLRSLASGMDNLVAPSAHLMFWFSMKYYQETFDALTAMGWTVDPYPLVWHKSDNLGILRDPKRGPRNVYEVAFMASRGDRHIVRAVSNVVSAPTSKLIHMSEKPIPVLRKFMEMFVDKFTMAFDPTAGSANSIRAALSLGAPSALGLEISPEFYARSVDAFNADTSPTDGIEI